MSVKKGPGRPHPPRGWQPPPARPRAPSDVDVVYGLRAGLAVIEARPIDVTAVAYGRAARSEVLDAMRRARRGDGREVHDDELARLAGSAHHEGLVVTTRPRRWLGVNDLADRLVRAQGACVALDRVRNPYNIGAVIRTAAFFGIDAALLGAPAPHPALAPDAVRVAEGGCERIGLCRTTDLADSLARLRARGVRVVAADGRADASAFDFRFTRPTVLVMGHEREGIGERVRAQCDAIVSIPGSGAIESLNVAVAAGVLVAQIARDAR